MKQIKIISSIISLCLLSFILTTQSINKNEDPIKLENIEILANIEQTEMDCTVAGGMCLKDGLPKIGIHFADPNKK